MTFNLIKLRKLQYIFIALIMLTGIQKIKAQLASNDSAWVIQSSLSDDFTGSRVDSTKWDTAYCYYNNSTCYNVANGAEWDFGRNDSVAGGYLYIKADTLKSNKVAAWGTWPYGYGYGDTLQSLTYAYQGGVVHSVNPSYGHGYAEISAKYPSNKYPLWPAFWVQNGSSSFYNEIDIAENAASQSYAGNQVQNNYWVDKTSGNVGTTHTQIYNLPVTALADSFHTFSAEWDTLMINYYFDGKLLRTVNQGTTDSVPQHGMYLFMNFCVDPWAAKLPSNWTNLSGQYKPPTHWPQHFIIDYLHYYKLSGGNTHCSNALTLTDPINYNRAVYSTINTGGGSNTATFSPADWNHSYTLRATNYIELDAGTTINPSGTTGYFAIQIMGCP